MIQVSNEIVALDLDLACVARLLKFDNDVAAANAKMIAYEVGKMLTGAD